MLSYDNVYYTVQHAANVWVCGWNSTDLWPFSQCFPSTQLLCSTSCLKLLSDTLLRLSITYGLWSSNATNDLCFLLPSIIVTAITHWPQNTETNKVDRNPPITVHHEHDLLIPLSRTFFLSLRSAVVASHAVVFRGLVLPPGEELIRVP